MGIWNCNYPTPVSLLGTQRPALPWTITIAVPFSGLPWTAPETPPSTVGSPPTDDLVYRHVKPFPGDDQTSHCKVWTLSANVVSAVPGDGCNLIRISYSPPELGVVKLSRAMWARKMDWPGEMTAHSRRKRRGQWTGHSDHILPSAAGLLGHSISPWRGPVGSVQATDPWCDWMGQCVRPHWTCRAPSTELF